MTLEEPARLPGLYHAAMPTLEHPAGGRWGFWWAANLIRTQALLVVLVAVRNVGMQTVWAGLLAVGLWVAASLIGREQYRAVALITIVAEIGILAVSAYAVFTLGWYYPLFIATCSVSSGALLTVLLIQGRRPAPSSD